jgi:hypothetical protein
MALGTAVLIIGPLWLSIALYGLPPLRVRRFALRRSRQLVVGAGLGLTVRLIKKINGAKR